MSKKYCAVIGNPIEHSRSQEMYYAFAAQTGMNLHYERILAPLDRFKEAAQEFRSLGGNSLNVTIPFKQQARAMADNVSKTAYESGSANMLTFEADGSITANNFDGVGLVRDIQENWKFALKDKMVLVLGAGGAVRGCLNLLLAECPKKIVVANRTVSKAEALGYKYTQIQALGLDKLDGKSFDIIINGTNSSLQEVDMPIPDSIINAQTYCYDMVYDKEETHFMRFCRERGAEHCRDGLGMLLEQGAEAFHYWFQVRPDTAPLLANQSWMY